MKTAVVFLTKTPHKETITFAQEVQAQGDFDVFIIVDSNEELPEIERKGIRIIQVADDEVAAKGYKGCNIDANSTHIQKELIAYDKFLYSFCEYYTNHKSVLVFEDDVFIPTVQTIIDLNNKYKDYDLVTANNFKRTNDLPDWHWPKVTSKIEAPYYYSMVCAMRISRNMLNCVKKYVDEKKQLFYQEVMFNTLAMQNNLKVTDAFEFKSVVWKGFWGLDAFLLLPNNVFHPIKEIDNYPELRKQIVEAKENNYVPLNYLPEFITELMN